jgi:hypothetical protein
MVSPFPRKGVTLVPYGDAANNVGRQELEAARVLRERIEASADNAELLRAVE